MNTVICTQIYAHARSALDELEDILDQNKGQNDPLSEELKSWGSEVLQVSAESVGLSPAEVARIAIEKVGALYLLTSLEKGHPFAAAMDAWAQKWNPKMQAELALLHRPEQHSIKNIFQQMLQRTRLAQQQIVAAETQLRELPGQIDRQIVKIQAAGAVRVAEATQKAREMEVALQGQIEAMSQAHQADLQQRAQEMMATEQKQTQEIAGVRMDMERQTLANGTALAERRRHLHNTEQARNGDRVKYQSSLQTIRQNSSQATADLQRHLGTVQAERRSAIASMGSQVASLASQMAGKVAKGQQNVAAWERRLAEENSNAGRLEQAVQTNLQAIDNLRGQLHQVQAELNYQRERRRGTRIFGARVCIIS